MSFARTLGLAMVLALGLQGRAVAQLPGESVFSEKGNLRSEFLVKTYDDVRRSLAGWAEAVNRADPKALKQLVVPDLFLGPIEGWLVKGPEALDSLGRYFPRFSGYSVTVLDFDASGSIAYVYATVRYQYSTPAGHDYREVDGTFVLLQRRDSWKVRSYVEKPRVEARTQ